MKVFGTVLMLISFAITGLLGLLCLFVFPPIGIVLLLIAFVGWSSWAGRIAVEAKARELQTLGSIQRKI